MNIEEAKKSGTVKLNVGSGIGHGLKRDFVNIDIVDDPKIDLVCDIRNGLPLENESVDFIECLEVLEHLHQNKVGEVVKDFYRVLKPGGKIILSVPNLPVIIFLWLANIDGKKWKKWIDCIYGGQVYPSDTHITGFDKERLYKRFNDAGEWSRIKVYENGEYGRQLVCEAVKLHREKRKVKV